MKKQFIILTLAFGLVQLSCGDNTHENEATLDATNMEEVIKEEVVDISETLEDATEVDLNEVEGPDYAASFEDFKEATLNKDLEAFKAYCTAGIEEPESIMNSINSDGFKALFEAATFADLEEPNVEGNDYLMLNLLLSDEEDGFEYESAIMLYFVSTAEGLMLDNTLFAG